jgi:UDP-N-acetylmuramoyl-tripeptide--D-alanyl-D-alanine ligase
MDIPSIHNLFLKCNSVSIDTRKIEPNSLFIALKGENFDANTFAKEALSKGAAYIIIDNQDYYIDQRTILVKNSLNTLQELAKFHRNYLKLPIIALTGSNGKTTTKELINVVLSKKFNTKATIGNLNNHIGVPLTLLSFTTETEIGIVEMGANHKKEIAFLCELTNPDFGYITNFGKAHLEGFGGIEGVIQGKSEMYQNIELNKKIAFINADDPIQIEKSKQLNRYSFGINNKNTNVSISAIEAKPLVTISYSSFKIKTNLIGLYNANNVNAALTIGNYFGVKDQDIKKALESYVPVNNRSQLITKGTNHIILDAYNANPSSMAVAIENFIQLEQTDKILILGDMFELGKESQKEHETIINILSVLDQIDCYLVGLDFFSNKIDCPSLNFFESYEKLTIKLKKIEIKNATILIKGSRGMALERVLDYL